MLQSVWLFVALFCFLAYGDICVDGVCSPDIPINPSKPVRFGLDLDYYEVPMQRIQPDKDLCDRAKGVFVEMQVRNSSWHEASSKILFGEYTKINISRSEFQPWNPRDYQKSCVIIQPGDLSSLQTVMWHAFTNNITLRIYGGGHDYLGYSSWGGPVVNMQLLKHKFIQSDEATGQSEITLEPGNRWRDVYAELDKNPKTRNLYVSGGLCPPVGVVGFTLGGGINHGYCRHYKLAVNNLLQAQLVTVRGDLVTANLQENADLFWALRGGHGGNFGVVTNLTFALHDSGGKIASGIQYYFTFKGLDKIRDSLKQMREFAHQFAINEEMLGLDAHVTTGLHHLESDSSHLDASTQNDCEEEELTLDRHFCMNDHDFPTNIPNEGIYCVVRIQWNTQYDIERFTGFLNAWTGVSLSNEKWQIHQACQNLTFDDPETFAGDGHPKPDGITTKCTRTAGEEKNPLHLRPLADIVETQNNFFVSHVPDDLIDVALRTQQAARWIKPVEFVFSLEFMYNCTDGPTSKVSYPHGDVWFWYWECYSRDNEEQICNSLSKYLSEQTEQLTNILGMYSNYNSNEFSNSNDLYFGPSFPYLQKIKQLWDPTEFLCFEDSLPLPGNDLPTCVKPFNPDLFEK